MLKSTGQTMVLFLISLIMPSYSESQTIQYPTHIRDFIYTLEGACSKGKLDLDHALIYKKFPDHKIEYYVFDSQNTKCSIVPHFMSGPKGHRLVVYAHIKKQWLKIFDRMVLDYDFDVGSHKDTPVTIYVHEKEGDKAKAVTYEWNAKKGMYIIAVK